MKLLLAILAAATLSTSIAAAETKTYPTAKLSINLPDKWKVKDAKNGITMVGAPNDDAAMIVFPAIAPTAESVKKTVDDLITSMKMTDVTWDKDVMQDKINGLPAFARKGKGTAEKKVMDLGAILVMNDKNGLVIVAFVQQDKRDSYKDAMNATIKSIAATK